MGNLVPYLTAILAVSCYAVLPPFAKKMGLVIPNLAFIGITMAILSVLAFSASWIVEKDFSLKNISGNHWATLVLFALINFTGFIAFLFALKSIPVTHYQMIGMMMPILGGVVAYLLLDEKIEWRSVAGFAVMAVGLTIALYKR